MIETIKKFEEKGFDLVQKSITIDSISCRINEEGRFFLITGNKNKPEGIFSKTPPDLVLVFNDNHGVFFYPKDLIQCLKDNKDALDQGIDKTYKKMGVWLNLGVITPYVSEETVKLFSQFYEHDS